MSTPDSKPAGISLSTAVAVVVANMVGTGVFTSLGFQVGGLPSGFALLVLWAVGGLCAFCGALAYGELAAAMPRSGGEYHFLARIFHPAAGFMAGWISFTVGFAAPIALAAMAFGKYFGGVVPGASATVLSVFMVLVVAVVHSAGIHTAARFQNAATWMKVALILVFIGAGAALGEGHGARFTPAAEDWALVTSTPFAVSLVYVMYAYAGWNATTYIVGDIREPRRNVPLSIALGTLLVTGLYLALNTVFLHAAPMDELEGRVEVGHVAAGHLFGESGGRLMSGLICLGLVSSVSAMTWVGPRVAMTMGQDARLLAPLARVDRRGTPQVALALQTLIVAALLMTSTFEKVLTCVQFSIQLCSFLTVLGVMVLRRTQPGLRRPVRCWGYPLTPLIFMGISLWMLVYVLKERTWESLAGLGIMVSGLLVYAVSAKNGMTAKAL
ncbi:MAG TPA: amino acid permease [Prosthecobacter sp.]|nr:amino acid permease [Prosthecobacter sp.]HRK13141.1 amino acid permease [Prosthecobacter sp.]